MPDITNNFKVWAEDLETNPNAIPSVSDFTSDSSSDRKDGFKPNTAASSQWANAGLRQANLFVASFMEVMKELEVDISNANLASEVDSLKVLIKQGLQSKLLYRHCINIDLPTETPAALHKYQGLNFEFLSTNSNNIFTGLSTLSEKAQKLGMYLSSLGYSSSSDQPARYLSCNGYFYYNNTYYQILGIYCKGGLLSFIPTILCRSLSRADIEYETMSLITILSNDSDIDDSVNTIVQTV